MHSLHLVKVGHHRRSLTSDGWRILTVSHCIISTGEMLGRNVTGEEEDDDGTISFFVLIREKRTSRIFRAALDW